MPDSTELAEVSIPESYERWRRTSAFLDLLGPIWASDEPTFRLALRLDDRHVNRRATAHGGFLVSIADVALGYAVAKATAPPTPVVTVNLTTDFIGPARTGAWVEFVSHQVRLGSRMAFSEGSILADGARIARISAVFAVQRLK